MQEQIHMGAVVSRIHESCLVADPIAVTLEGKTTELSLEDALELQAGLDAAIKRVQASEAALKGDGDNWNVAVMAKSGSGMSFPRTKLGNGGIRFVGSNLEELAKVSPDEAKAILANANTKIFLKTDASAPDVPAST